MQWLTLTALTFLGVLAVVFGTYWVVVVQPEQAARNALARRLHTRKLPTEQVRKALLKEAERLSAIPALNKVLAGRAPFVGRLRTLIEQSGLRVTVGTIVLSSICLALMVYALVVFLFRAQFFGLVLGLLAAWIPTAYVKRVRTKRIRRFEELFPEAIDLIARSLRAGHAFTTGLAMVADEVPNPVGREFRLLYDQQNYGMPLPEALRSFGDRIPLLDAKFFVTAVLTQREAGGNLSEVLDNLTSVIRDRFKIKREVRSKSAHGRLTGWVLALLPPTLALVLFTLSPEWMTQLTKDPLGVRMIIVAVVLQIIGTLAIRKIVDIEY